MFRTTALAVFALSTLVSGARLSSSSRSIFDFLPRAELYPACLKTVSTALARRAPQAPITTEETEPLCENIIIAAPNSPGSRTTAVLADCAELSGRIEEAAKNGYLSDGSEFCGNILKQSAKENNEPLNHYVPRGSISKKKFCAHFSAAVDSCAGFQAETSRDETPAAELLHSAEAMDAPAMPHPSDVEAQATESHLAENDAPATNMAAAPPAEEEHPSKMTKQYMQKNFGKLLRFGATTDDK